jgi:hypothetical protein
MQARISFDHHSNGALRSATIMEPVITSAEQCANMIATLARLVSWFGEDTAKGGRKTTERITSTSVLASLPLALPAPKRGPYKKRAKPTEEQTEVPNGTVKRLEIITKGIKETLFLFDVCSIKGARRQHGHYLQTGAERQTQIRFLPVSRARQGLQTAYPVVQQGRYSKQHQ